MDSSTIAAYDLDAASFAREWSTQPPPTDLHDVVRRFFAAGPTADIGCGAGRDTAWLNLNGYPATGFDPSQSLLHQARNLYPEIRFEMSSLPDLDGIENESYDNVLCETVIMHIPAESIRPSVRRLMSVLRPGGTLYLSWRVTPESDRRDDHGRLYSAFDPALVFEGLDAAEILLDEQLDSRSSGKLIRRLVARKPKPA